MPLSEDYALQPERLRNKAAAYDPFVRGSYPVGVRTFTARDDARNRIFPCEI